MTTMFLAGLRESIAAGESKTLEYKTTFDKVSIESLVAFANAQNGTVLAPVSDDGLVKGVTEGKETLNEWLGQIKSSTSPPIIPDLVAQGGDGKTVVVIKVGEFPVKPVSTRGHHFKRVASSNHQLNRGEIADLYMQSLQLSRDAYETRGASLDALSPQKNRRFIRLVNENGRFSLEGEPVAALQKPNYIVNDHPAWAAMLLFAKEPFRHHIHIGRFKTTSVIIEDRQITATLFEAVDQAMEFIESHIGVGFEFDDGIQWKERFAYPLPTLREVLLNAVVYRSYTDPNDIQIKIFDDKITIFSLGTAYAGISVADIQADNCRSRLSIMLVAEGFYLVNVIEKFGSGFIRIRNALKEYPEIDFEIKEFAGGVTVIFVQKSPELGGVSGGVSTEFGSLLELIRSQPDIRVAELVNQTGKPARTIERWLKQLKDRQRIEFRGAPITGGYFPQGIRVKQ